MSWTENNNQLLREYNFLDLSKALEFINQINILITDSDSLPEIKLFQGRVEIAIKTSNDISKIDRDLAQSIELEFTKFSNSIDFAIDTETGKKIYLPIDIRLRNQLIVGKQGCGKSQVITNQILKDINQGRGVCLFDPNGQIVDDVFKDLTEEQKKNTVLLDFANKSNNFSLNLLDKQYTQNQNLDVVNNLLNSVFDDLDSADPVYDSYLNNTLSLLFKSQESTTLGDLTRFFTDPDFKKNLIEKNQDQDLKNFWLASSKNLSSSDNLEIVATEIVAKIDKFVRDQFLKEYLLSTKPSFDFSSSILSNKNILIKLPVQILGQEVASILSSVLFYRLKQALIQRDSTNSEYFVYIDNFEKLANYDLLELVGSSKSFKTGFVITLNSLRKFMNVLDKDAVDQVMENTAIHTFFKSEYLDAEIVNQWYNEQVDIDSLRDPIKFGGYILFDDKSISFEQ